MNARPKQRKSICMTAFPAQFTKLRPENSKAGGIKAMSGSGRARNLVYAAINQLFRQMHPWCECHHIIFGGIEHSVVADDTHHVRGRNGMLLFDVRHFKAVCRQCHTWIHSHTNEAHKLGLLDKP